ncbi:MAG TPA: condensation domain-containing protein, partial [Pyrinomonadaceae bacterium]
MTTAELISELRSLGVRLRPDGERLRYSAPSGVLTPELLKTLAESKGEILAFLRSAAAAAEPSALPLLPAPRGGESPLSFAQQRLWFTDQLTPGTSANNVSAALHLRGSLNAAALRQTLAEIVRRHEVLRTTFPVINERPFQRIEARPALVLPVVDLGSLPAEIRAAAAKEIARAEAHRPFDLARGPLLRATLLRLCGREHVVLLTLHHIVSDAWSLTILLREVATLYESFSRGSASPLVELPVQYADFAHWQRRWMSGEVLDKQLRYWKGKLGGELLALELPTDRPRPAVQSFRGTIKTLTLPEPLSAALNELCRRENVTLFMALLAAFKVLLQRYAEQDDILVGTSIASRNQLAAENLIGLFVNTLVLRTDLSGDPSFKELLERVRKVTLESYAHQDLPFETLVEELQPERDLSRNPLFQVLFAVHNTPLAPMELPGLSISPVEIEHRSSLFDLALMMGEREQRIWCSLEYSTDLFDGATMERLLGHLRTLLQSIAANPEQRLSSLEMVSDEERELLTRGWARGERRDFSGPALLHAGAWESARSRPDAVAVSCAGEHLSYSTLRRLSR